jgi:poly-gamma-glutamate synthesis protein (capsule biosynthesis protein)
MVKINFMGDVMFGELLENYHRGLKTVIEKRNIDPFEHVGPVLKEADLNVINLECVFSDTSILEKPFSEILISPERFVRYLTDNNINVVNTANNHALDHGKKEFEKSVGILKNNGINVIGYDTGCFFQEEPVVVEAGERKIGFLGYNISNFPDPDKKRSIDRIKVVATGARQSVDTLVVSMHWGEEYTNIPPPYVVEFGKDLIAVGVDILCGHHSHRIQGVLKDRNRIFAPSLGNFIFDQKVERNRITAILQVQMDEDGGLAFRYMPFYMNDLYQPVEAPEYEGYIDEINVYLEDCYEKGAADRHSGTVEKNVRKGHRENRVRMRIRMLAHFWDYLPYVRRILAFKRSGESMYSVIKSEDSLDNELKDSDVDN